MILHSTNSSRSNPPRVRALPAAADTRPNHRPFPPVIAKSHPSSKRLEEQLVNVAPAPILAGLEGFDYRVMDGTEMFRRVPVGRVITTADVTALHAEA